MANAVFSPKDFKAWIIEEVTTGTAPAITSALFQLDVDAIAFPSLNVTQVSNVRSQTGRIAHINDFYQDNELRTVEVSLSGTWHNDAGHSMLLESAANVAMSATVANVVVGEAPTSVGGKYGESEGNKTFTLVLASPDTTDGQNIVIPGCLCTNFTINADMGTDGGQYKWSCTVSSGKVIDLTNGDTPAGTAYGATHVSMPLIDISEVKIFNLATPVLSSFSVSIDSPAVYSGVAEGGGYACFGRGEEIAITASAQIKLDSLTMELPDLFDNQDAHIAAGLFIINQATDAHTSIAIPCGILTNVAYAPGDIMMLDVEMKALNNGSADPITFTLA